MLYTYIFNQYFVCCCDRYQTLIWYPLQFDTCWHWSLATSTLLEIMNRRPALLKSSADHLYTRALDSFPPWSFFAPTISKQVFFPEFNAKFYECTLLHPELKFIFALGSNSIYPWESLIFLSFVEKNYIYLGSYYTAAILS